MSKKQKFINAVDELFRKTDMPAFCGEDYEDVINYWNVFKEKKEVEKPMFTDNGKLILTYMQEHAEDLPMAKAKDIGEGLFVSSRTVSGAIRKLITDGFVEKVGTEPTIYALTEKGKTVEIN